MSGTQMEEASYHPARTSDLRLNTFSMHHADCPEAEHATESNCSSPTHDIEAGYHDRAGLSDWNVMAGPHRHNFEEAKQLHELEMAVFELGAIDRTRLLYLGKRLRCIELACYFVNLSLAVYLNVVLLLHQPNGLNVGTSFEQFGRLQMVVYSALAVASFMYLALVLCKICLSGKMRLYRIMGQPILTAAFGVSAGIMLVSASIIVHLVLHFGLDQM